MIIINEAQEGRKWGLIEINFHQHGNINVPCKNNYVYIHLFVFTISSLGHGYLRNYQAAYLGYKKGESFESFLKRINEKFSVIIITEYFDESLVLLRRQFCWDIKDMIYVELRSRKYESKHNIPAPSAVANHHVYSAIDYALYDYFVMKLLVSINAEPKFWDELYVFRKVKENVQTYCADVISRLKAESESIYGMAEKKEEKSFDPSPWGHPFVVSAVDCAMMALRTLVHRNMLKVRQFPELCRYPVAKETAIWNSIIWYQEGVSLQMNTTYCKGVNKDHLSMAVLASKEAYMWYILKKI